MEQILLGIDIGSTKICAIIANCKDGVPHIIGTGFHKSQGLKKGSITNIEQASRAIKDAVNDAKRVAGTNINKAVISISSAYTKSTDSSGVLNCLNNEIGIKEINRVIQSALYNASIPNEYEVVHILPYNFKLDDQDFIDDPMGMSGGRLEVSVRIITAQKLSLGNLKKAIKTAGIEIENIVLASYASSIAVLTEDEKNLGVACIDMGGSTCELMIHVGNSLRYNDFLGVGSNHITNDLAMALHTPQSIAEQVKIQYGGFPRTSEDTENLIEIPSIGGSDNDKHQVSLAVVHNVVYARVEETLMILAKSLEHSNLKDQLGSGIVLTGGMVQLDGIRDLAAALFNAPVRLANPIEIDGLFTDLKGPECSTAIGLVLYASGKYTNYEIDSEKRIRYLNEKLGEETEQLSKNIHLINPLQDKQSSIANPVNSVPKSAADIKQDLSNITEIKKIQPKNNNFIRQMWEKLTQMF
ncbi:MAG: cell division protein FtsA [Helicobacter sp.]|uniref:cell division protein FtsA n=1 Tax=Helicobacter sp. TaxID=218 RepID=UPI0023BCC949|nr:cell division protein FtsA [Helicobacter sp.]MDE5926675.1 cell division protein FtsA [Helicobacter sp.]MDE7175179.1 cell division protein FtsA [Helicobacter sp.]